MQQLADASLTRLKNWDISDEQIRDLASSGNARRTLTFRSPVSGIVTEKKAVQGMRFMPGETLYQVADLSTVWVIADVFEQDIGLVKSGARPRIKINAYPDKTFEGTITYIYPTLNGRNPHGSGARRTEPIPELLLKPGMFARWSWRRRLRARCGGPCRFRPSSTAARARSSWCRAEGRFEPREVKLGARSENHVEVRDGVREGEQGGGRRQLPDRRREQPQGGGRWLRSRGPPAASQVRSGRRRRQAGPASTATGPKARWRRSTPAAVSRASAMARWPASNGRR
jgi:Cu(I)/Ag(I) efflux system membrane fusion protein